MPCAIRPPALFDLTQHPHLVGTINSHPISELTTSAPAVGASISLIRSFLYRDTHLWVFLVLITASRKCGTAMEAKRSHVCDATITRTDKGMRWQNTPSPPLPVVLDLRAAVRFSTTSRAAFYDLGFSIDENLKFDYLDQSASSRNCQDHGSFTN